MGRRRRHRCGSSWSAGELTASRSDDGAINARRVAISGETWRTVEQALAIAAKTAKKYRNALRQLAK